jgi:biotin carboxyl carrier protein
MADEKKGHFPEAGKPAESGKLQATMPGDAHGTLHVAARRTEELSAISKKMEQVVNLFAEVSEYLEKAMPKQKRLLDEARVKISDVAVVLQQTADDEISGVHRIVAPMPGVIMQCEKKVGQNVKAGDLVLILDAMKMENPITAPVEGKIVSLPCVAGQKVAKGSVLAVISIKRDRNLSVAR